MEKLNNFLDGLQTGNWLIVNLQVFENLNDRIGLSCPLGEIEDSNVVVLGSRGCQNLRKDAIWGISTIMARPIVNRSKLFRQDLQFIV